MSMLQYCVCMCVRVRVRVAARARTRFRRLWRGPPRTHACAETPTQHIIFILGRGLPLRSTDTPHAHHIGRFDERLRQQLQLLWRLKL